MPKKRGKLRPSPEKSIRFEQGGEVYPKRMEIAAEHGAVSSKSALVKVNCLKGGMRTLPVATPRRLLKEDTGQAGEIEPSIVSSIHKYKYTNTEWADSSIFVESFFFFTGIVAMGNVYLQIKRSTNFEFLKLNQMCCV